ncbi:SulP family inorganic anion transporter [Pseudorhodoferax sp. Leaf274]|uniref:SulP family inorganic anion transporter n=1 Tax=Pseudorhodoferax sp. Leaf274 TaxID=1736318 RepID=UPI00070287A1|nr:SulP family inorganic anion transporter [Pseudorhodoferax sp. Leaf274]KQP40038.1 sulfate transporter [Pseudorhodoferax sp. Leaf274]
MPEQPQPSPRHAWRRFFPFLSWPRPDRATLQGEALAGLTVGMMVIPQGVAYAALAGMPLVTGIYASLLPALIAVLFSASTRLSVGPTALSCLLIAASLSGMAPPGSPQWVNLAVWLALLSGLLQVVLGLARFGWLLNVVSAPVLMGFTQAAAVLILLSQLGDLLGLPHGWRAAQALQQQNPGATLFGIGSLALLLLSRRLSPRLPAVVLVVLAAAAISWTIGFEAAGGGVVGALPAGMPQLYLPQWPGWQDFSRLLVPALVITLISFLETASSAKVDSQKGGQRWDQDQDLIGQGLAKLASGVSGAFPTSSSFSRSALNLYAGARTGWATVASVVVVLVALVWLTPLLHPVPQAVLAAIVVAAVMGLVKPAAFVQLWRVSRVEAVTAGVTFGVTVLSAPALYWGVIAGLLMSLSHFLYLRLHPRIIEIGLHPDGSLRDRHLWHLPPLAPRLCALRMDGGLDFASANAFERAVLEQLAAHPDVRHVCVFALSINHIDATGVEMFSQLRKGLRERGICLHIAGMKLPVERVLLRAGELPATGATADPLLRLYRTDAEALAAFRHPGMQAPA